MSGPLFIQQGSSPDWWLSPAIWVTTVSDTTTKVTNPIAGEKYTVWVQVQNKYPDPVDSGWNLFVCWTIPTAGDLKVSSITSGQILNGFLSSAGPQGSAIGVPIPGGSTVNLQAATTWTPSYENHGHECLIAMAYAEQAIGGLPVTVLQGNAPWTDVYTIAQHNLAVLPAVHKMGKRFQYPFLVCNAAHQEHGYVITARQAPLSEIAEFLPGIRGGRRVIDHPGKVEHLGIVPSRHPDPTTLQAARATLSSHRIPGDSCQEFTLGGSLSEGNALIHVTQSLDGRVVGGLSVLVMSEEA